jgi:transcriptional regulator
MYIPTSFAIEDIEVLHRFMHDYSFATLVTQVDGVPFATHLPTVLDEARGLLGTIESHMARANPHWRNFDETHEVLLLFQGPHSYISPSWYVDNAAASVPTWNYAVVHAYGMVRMIKEPERVRGLLERLIQKNEGIFEQSWEMRFPDEELRKRMSGFVCFEIEITRLEGKGKLSQNRTANDRQHVITALEQHEELLGEGAVGVADLMKRGTP